MQLKMVINTLRRLREGLDQIYLILSLLEVDAHKTPFFQGLDDQELVIALNTAVRMYRTKFVQEFLDEYSEGDFYGYLASQSQFNFDIQEFCGVYNQIRKQGEEYYGFTCFDGVDKKDS